REPDRPPRRRPGRAPVLARGHGGPAEGDAVPRGADRPPRRAGARRDRAGRSPEAGVMPLDVPGQKRAAAEAAVAFVKKGYVVGLGTGSTAKYAILKLGDMAQDGFEVRGVPTSMATANLAKEHGIPLTSLEECPEIDLTIDGADEVDPHLDMIKGMGGALFREKLVAAASKKVAIAVDASKLVKKLGSRVPVPVEVHPFGWKVSKARLEALGGAPELRVAGGATVRTDNDNYLLDT